jgi:tRNA G18 (ribose-2'-O)-methylase SpoU
MSARVLYGFHAVTVRLKTAPESVLEVHVDGARRDARMRQFVERAAAAGARIVDSDGARLDRLAGTARHQGVVARVLPLAPRHSLDDVDGHGGKSMPRPWRRVRWALRRPGLRPAAGAAPRTGTPRPPPRR